VNIFSQSVIHWC